MRDLNVILDAEVVSDTEAMFVVEQYIKERKGVAVRIDLATNNPSPNQALLHIHIAKQLAKLMNAYKYASEWFLKRRDATEAQKYNRIKEARPPDSAESHHREGGPIKKEVQPQKREEKK